MWNLKFKVLNFTFLFESMKKVISVILGVVGLLLCGWIAERWDVWFGKHIEPEFQLTESVVGVQLTIGNNPMEERIVSWRSRGDSLLLRDETVRLIWTSEKDTIYPKVNKKWIKSEGGEAIYYWSKVKVKEGLYRYAIETIDTITPYYSTKVDYGDSLSLLIVGDVQDKRYDARTDSAVMRLKKDYDADFVLQLGDLIDRPHQEKWDLYFRSFEPLRTEVPMISIVGNHDYHKGINKYPDERFFYTFPYFLDEKHDAPMIGCCDLNFGNTILFILDSNQPVWRQLEQRKWLKNKFENTPDEARKIVALHHPLRSARSRFNNLIVRWMYEGLVKKYEVEFVLAGHEHTYYVLNKEETGGYEQIITNFSQKNYDDAKGEKGRKEVELRIFIKHVEKHIKKFGHIKNNCEIYTLKNE